MKKVIWPGDKRQELDGGLNTKFERSIIADNESPDCLNVDSSEGSTGTRDGIKSFTVSGIGSMIFDAVYTRNDNTGAETMIAWAGGTMRAMGANTFVTVPGAQSVFTPGNNVYAAQYENYMFFGNGVESAYKYNGTDFTRHGSYAPNTVPVASTAGVAGNVDGTVSYKVTYKNTNLVESDVNLPVSYTASSEQVTLTALPVAPQSWGVGSRLIYRTKGNSGTTYNLLTTINDNTTTDYTDNTLDANLGAEAPEDQGVPPTYKIIMYYMDRLFVNDIDNPNWVWYSELGNPYVFKSTNFWKFGDNTSDLVRSFGLFNNAFVVFGDDSYQVVYMPDSTPANWKFIPGPKLFGCKSPKGIFNYQNKLMFPAIQNEKFVGFATLAGIGTEPDVTHLTTLNAVSDLNSNKIEPNMFTINDTYVENIAATVFKNKAYITVPHGTSQTTNNRTYQFDFSISNAAKPNVYTWIPWSGFNAKQFTIYDGKLYFADATANDGHVYQMFGGAYNDNGAAIDSYIWTKELAGAKTDAHYHKDLKEVFAFMDMPGNWYMDLNIRTDSDDTDGDTYQVSLNPGGSLWGTAVWGTDTWGGGKKQDEKTVTNNASGKRFQFKFSNQNTVDQSFKIHGFGFRYNRKGLR